MVQNSSKCFPPVISPAKKFENAKEPVRSLRMNRVCVFSRFSLSRVYGGTWQITSACIDWMNCHSDDGFIFLLSCVNLTITAPRLITFTNIRGKSNFLLQQTFLETFTG